MAKNVKNIDRKFNTLLSAVAIVTDIYELKPGLILTVTWLAIISNNKQH